MYRCAACAGSHLAELDAVEKLRDQQGKTKTEEVDGFINDASAEGTAAHGWMADITTGNEIGAAAIWNTLKPHTQEMCQSALRSRTKLLDDLLPGWNTPENPAKLLVEQRLWLHTPTKARRKVASGQPDLFAYRNRTAVLIDYKFGWFDVESAEANWQLRTLAAISKQSIDPEKVFVAIIQPKLGVDAPAEFDVAELQRAEQDVLAISTEALKKKSARTAGPHCTYCKAAGFCKEAKALAERPWEMVGSGAPVVELTKEMVEQAVEATTLEQCVAAWKMRRPIKWINDAVVSRLKTTPADQLAAVGVRLKPGKSDPRYRDLDQLYQTLDLSFAEYMKCFTLSKGAMVELFMSKYNLSKSAAEGRVEMLLSEFRDDGRMADELAEIK